MIKAHVVAPDMVVEGGRPLWLVGECRPEPDYFADHWGYGIPEFVDAAYNFDDAMNIARELDQQWEPDCGA